MHRASFKVQLRVLACAIAGLALSPSSMLLYVCKKRTEEKHNKPARSIIAWSADSIGKPNRQSVDGRVANRRGLSSCNNLH